MIIRVSAVQPCRGRYPAHPNVRVPASPHPPTGHDKRPQNIKIKFMRPNGFGFLRTPRPSLVSWSRVGGEAEEVRMMPGGNIAAMLTKIRVTP